MKQTIRTVAALVMLSVTFAGCQKEEALPVLQPQVESNASVYAVSYIIDGEMYHQTVAGRQALMDLLQRMMALAREGHSVQVWDGNSCSGTFQAKETVTYTTHNENDALVWSAQMIDKGYKVSIEIKDGVYVCTAVR